MKLFLFVLILIGAVEKNIIAADYIVSEYNQKPFHLEVIGASFAHNNGIFGQNVKVALIDVDFFDCQSDTKNSISKTTKDRWSGIANKEQWDRGSHANATASIIAGMHGIAPQAELEVFSVSSSQFTSDEEWERWCHDA